MPCLFDVGVAKTKLPLMRLRCLTLFMVVVAAACGRADDARNTPGIGASGATLDSTITVAMTGEWPADLGTALVIPSDTENLAVVLYPAVFITPLDPKTPFALVTSGGDTVRVRVRVTGLDSAYCGDAPTVRLSRGTPLVWSIGITDGAARPMRADSLDAVSSADSLLYSTEASRLASAVSVGAPSRLAGLPFALTSLRRLRVGDTTIIAAQLVRRVNQEANPAEERTFVIAEQAASAPFKAVYSMRSEGTEETTAHFDLIGALGTGPVTYLVLAMDSPSGSTVEVLERSGGTWRVRWTRSIGC